VGHVRRSDHVCDQSGDGFGDVFGCRDGGLFGVGCRVTTSKNDGMTSVRFVFFVANASAASKHDHHATNHGPNVCVVEQISATNHGANVCVVEQTSATNYGASVCVARMGLCVAPVCVVPVSLTVPVSSPVSFCVVFVSISLLESAVSLSVATVPVSLTVQMSLLAAVATFVAGGVGGFFRDARS